MNISAREAAYLSLIRIEKESRFSNLETDLTLKKNSLSDLDARLYTRLVYGTIERRITLDFVLKPLLSCPIERVDREAVVIMRMTAYQLLYADRIPDSAAVNEGVELCKKYRKGAVSFVNAVLRRLAREKENIVYPDEKRDPISFLSVYYSVSYPLCAHLYRRFGAEESKKLLQAVNEQPSVTLRVNSLVTDRESLCAEFEKEGIAYKKTELSPDGVKIGANVRRIAALEEGRCYVQDEASQLAVIALDAKEGMTVLDLCSCPGGKSFGAAIKMKNSGKVCSYDLHENKLSLVRSGAEKLGITIIETASADARVFDPSLEGRADRVLVDVPCSGLGVMAKKPDLRYKKEEEIARLPEIQRAILKNACRYVKPGGRLVYSTCTILPRENEEIVEEFLSTHPDFVSADLRLSDVARGKTSVTLLPHIHHTDGFFIAALERKNEQ